MLEKFKCRVTHTLAIQRKFNTIDEEHKYAGKTVYKKADGNRRIYELLSENKPVLIGRFGSNELNAMAEGVLNKYPLSDKKRAKVERSVMDFYIGAGFYPQDTSLLPRFAEEMKSACSQLDMLGVWYKRYEDYMIKKYAPNAELCPLQSIEPYYYMNEPWSRVLEGKKILVIHPFADSIRMQYEKRDKLFSNPQVLPRFELKTFKSVQSMAGHPDERFETWFDALEYMHQEVRKIDFDVAIVGCGAYGLPLAARIKQDGHSVIHIGGATQILFGIRGKRWDAHPVISKLYNEYWVRPGDSEKIKDMHKVEDGGCYW